MLTRIMYDVPSDPTIEQVTITRRLREKRERSRDHPAQSRPRGAPRPREARTHTEGTERPDGAGVVNK